MSETTHSSTSHGNLNSVPVHTIPGPTSSGSNIASATPASQFQNELDTILRNASGEANLRALTVDCLLRHRPLTGIVWFAKLGNTTIVHAAQWEHPATQDQAVRDWITKQSRHAIDTQQDVIEPFKTIRNLSLIAVPFRLSNDRCEAITLLIAHPDPQRIDQETLAARTALRAIKQWYGQNELRQLNEQLRATSALLELSGRIETTDSIHEATRVLADSLQEYFDASIVAIGTCGKARKTTRLSAISGLPEFDNNSVRSRKIKAVLDEAVVRDEFAAWPSPSPESEHQLLAHQKLNTTYNYPTILSTPLRDLEGNCVGAVVIAGNTALNRPEIHRFLQAGNLPIGNALRGASRSPRGWLRRLASRIIGKPKWQVATVCGVGILATLLVMLLPMHYRIACRFRCEPLERRFCVAPYDGQLKQTLVEPGDTVVAGQVLAQMDSYETSLEILELQAKRNQARIDRDFHRANRNIAKSDLASLEHQRTLSQLELLQNRLKNHQIRSQIAGVVLSGSIDRRENYPVTKGQSLYEIAPLSPTRLEIAILAEERGHARPGMTVEFRPDSDPRRVGTGVIKRIRPRSETVGKQNVFIAEVEFDNADGTLRPGMEGSARVISDPHCLAWNLFHRPYEYTISTLWW